ncbi:hypothetical protein QJ857_gp0315 [Tupanvirus soda lake]|uniref:DUF5866 domain-containing protein n=2 Tax=Tupanvirus TaxID=2094720 RepID=A0A6N1NX10_9VIRU|nr:hypothetical protein QJ857_gp0315 [Tupanvirus soda lake]QKU35713.1 hypothetical protein [Tupanvirus soda lake]
MDELVPTIKKFDYYYINCPDGELKFKYEDVYNCVNIKDTLMDLVWFPKENTFGSKDTITIVYSIQIVKKILPLIRQGIIYNVENPQEKQELIFLIEYLAMNNNHWISLGGCLKNGTMDVFGKRILNVPLYFDTSMTAFDKKKQTLIAENIRDLVVKELKKISIDSNVGLLPNQDDMSLKKEAVVRKATDLYYISKSIEHEYIIFSVKRTLHIQMTVPSVKKVYIGSDHKPSKTNIEDVLIVQYSYYNYKVIKDEFGQFIITCISRPKDECPRWNIEKREILTRRKIKSQE